jgi:hypothetical protein
MSAHTYLRYIDIRILVSCKHAPVQLVFERVHSVFGFMGGASPFVRVVHHCVLQHLEHRAVKGKQVKRRRIISLTHLKKRKENAGKCEHAHTK